MSTVVEELIARLGFDLSNEADLKRFNAGMKSAGDHLRSLATVAGVAAAAVAAAVAGLGKGVIETSAEFESLAATLETVEGSAAKAKQALDWAAEFAKQTPYDLKAVSAAFVRLKAYGLDPTNGTLRDLGDAASALQKPLMSAVEALADAVTGENERLKEYGITASVAGDKVTYTWTQAGKVMKKTIRKDAVEIQKTLTGILGGRFGGAMARQAKTWDGLTSNIGDAWTRFKRKIGDAGFFEHAKRGIADFLDRVGELEASGKLDPWAKSISDALTFVTDAIGSSIDGITSAVGRMDEQQIKIITIIGGLMAAIGIWALPVVGPLALFTAAVLAIGIGLQDLDRYLKGQPSLIGDTVEAFKLWYKDPSMKGVRDTVEAISTSMKSLSSTIIEFKTAFGLIKEAPVGPDERQAENTHSFVGALKEAAKTLGIISGMQFKLLLDGLKWALDAAVKLKEGVEWLGKAFEDMGDAAQRAADKVKAAISSATGAFGSWWGTRPGGPGAGTTPGVDRSGRTITPPGQTRSRGGISSPTGPAIREAPLSPDERRLNNGSLDTSHHGWNAVDPQLREIMAEAARRSGMQVRVSSGYRRGDPRQHGRGNAADFQIIDPATGRPLPNGSSRYTRAQNAAAYRHYERLAEQAKQVQMERYPGLEDRFTWGGDFGGGPVPMDTMHFDVGGRRGAAGYWSQRADGTWQHNISPSYKRAWGVPERDGGWPAAVAAATDKVRPTIGPVGADRLIDPRRNAYLAAGIARSGRGGSTITTSSTANTTINVAGTNATAEQIGRAAGRAVESASQRAVAIAANEPVTP